MSKPIGYSYENDRERLLIEAGTEIDKTASFSLKESIRLKLDMLFSLHKKIK